MSNLYKKIEDLCNKKGINITQMCSQAGVSRGSLTDLKSGRSKTLTNSALVKIARFFNVSTDYLNGLDDFKETMQKENPTDTDIKYAIFNTTDNITDEMLDEVKQFAELVKLREEKKRRDKIKQSKNDDEIDVFIAAHSEGNTEIPQREKMSKSEWERLKSLPQTDDDF